LRNVQNVKAWWDRIAVGITAGGIAAHLFLRFALHQSGFVLALPLWIAIFICGLPLLYELALQIWHRQFGADFLAGLSILTAVFVGELLVAAIIILMLTGGQALEEYATHRASSVLEALANRTPSIAHRVENGRSVDISVDDVRIGDHLAVFPHEICPVDGTVVSGTGTMDESFLTGEPFRIRKTTGSQVISGALNEDTAFTIVADKLAVNSRYARIMQVMREAEASPPVIRRLADRLGAWYTPLAVAVALAAWAFSGQPERFLAVLVIATPCPLLIAIPITVIGAISLAAKRGIVVKKPVVLEQVGQVRSMFFDKTGTLTHGEPDVTEVRAFGEFSRDDVLRLSGALELYSKHPLAAAILRAADEERLVLPQVESISEKPGEGLRGVVQGKTVLVTGRRKLTPELLAQLPTDTEGMECVILVDGGLAGLILFRDRPRVESKPFIRHLLPRHNIEHLTILSGDRDSEVRYLAEIVGIEDVYAGLEPEDKLRMVQEETEKRPTLFLGDGINDAPAMMAATVGVAFGQSSDILAESAGAVILEPSLGRVDELLHIGGRMRRVALESAVGGIVLSLAGMIAASFGLLPPIGGAIGQEVIDLLAVLNALRASIPGKVLRDF
jgi:heavy metal translocating P-type ATPase